MRNETLKVCSKSHTSVLNTKCIHSKKCMKMQDHAKSVQRCTLRTLECHIGDVGEAWCNRLSVLANILLAMTAHLIRHLCCCF